MSDQEKKEEPTTVPRDAEKEKKSGELSEQELEKASGGGAYPPSPCGKII